MSAFEFVSLDEVMQRRGVRMVVVGQVPSPWGEAAKGIFHLKGLDVAAVRFDYASETMRQWTGGHRGGPAVVFDDEPPRTGWAEILLLAERIAPQPRLLPEDPALRALVFGLLHELFGEGGLAWTRRLQLVHAGLNDQGGFAGRVAGYLAKKYGYRPAEAAGYGPRVVQLLGMLAARLEAQAATGSRYYVGDSLSVVDVYSTACLAMFKPLPQAQCPMDAATRAAFETTDAATEAALAPVLLAHRSMMYSDFLPLPLAL